MKKSNAIIYALLMIISIFLLWLWYYLGFNWIDSPLDLVLSIIWWVMGAAVIVSIVRIEENRRERIRTVYISKMEIFNTETGKVALEEPAQLLNTVSGLVSDLKYDFSKAEFPEKQDFLPQLLIRTFKKNENTWTGEVINTTTKTSASFGNREELARILTMRG